MAIKQAQKINGIDVDAVKQVMKEVSEDSAKGKVKFRVATSWKEGARSDTRVNSYWLGGNKIKRNFTIPVDEPEELAGGNTAPNPQETLMAGLNACMLIGYVTGCSFKGIKLEKLEIETEGELDLRGFLGLDESVKPGYDEIHYTVRMKGNGTKEQFEEIHETVMASSPNFYNISHPIKLVPKLVVE
jgi:uncharacterized OsmC-like protein